MRALLEDLRAHCHLDLRQPEAVVRELGPLLAAVHPGDTSPEALADLDLALAQGLVEIHGDRRRARALIDRAAALLPDDAEAKAWRTRLLRRLSGG